MKRNLSNNSKAPKQLKLKALENKLIDSEDSQRAQNQPYPHIDSSKGCGKVQPSQRDQYTFLTGLNDVKKEPHEMMSNKLNSCVENIEGQFNHVLSKHEEDFLNAYKGHMTKVQKELSYLKNKASEAAGKILNDDSVTSLQSQIAWFKNEAIKLDAVLENQKREIQKMKSREQNLAEDRNFLKTQVKDAMKHNKLLEVAVKKTTSNNSALKEFLARNQASGEGDKSVQLKRGLSPKQIITQVMAQFVDRSDSDSGQEFDENDDQINIEIGKKDGLSTAPKIKTRKVKQPKVKPDVLAQDSVNFNIKHFVLDLFRRGYDKLKVQKKILKFFKVYDMSRDSNIQVMQRQLDHHKRINLKLKNGKAIDISDKTELENLFLDCVDECKKDVLRRKSIPASVHHNRTGDHVSSQGVQMVESIVVNKDLLITVFEDMFGPQAKNKPGKGAQNIGDKVRGKSRGSNHDNSISYFSNATTKEQMSEDVERFNAIMNCPIESLIQNVNYFTQDRKFKGSKRSNPNNNISAITSAYNRDRASTAIGDKSSLNNQTVIQTNDDVSDLFGGGQSRAVTSHSQGRRRSQISKNQNISTIVEANGKSRQQAMTKQTSSKDRSFTVKNGKLVVNPFQQNKVQL